MLQHEFERPRNKHLMTDVYDWPAWIKFMGPVTLPLQFPVSRIALQFCVDAIPAFAVGSLSLKPAEFINLSLPPALRTKSENIMLLMLLPNNLAKGIAQKKYYDFAAKFELDDIATNGIDGIKIKIFSSSMDTKGREELLGMQTCSSYQGCPVCTHRWTPGSVVGRKAVVCDGYRCFLCSTSRARQKRFKYRGNEYHYRLY